MRIFLNICFLLIVTSVNGEDGIDFSVTKSYWNHETNTLDIILHSNPHTIEDLFSHHESFNLNIDERKESEFELMGISKSLINISEKKSTIPNSILIVIDHGLNNSTEELLTSYRQLAAEIISKHPTGYVFELAVLSNRVSTIYRVSKFSLERAIKEGVKLSASDQPSDYDRLFKSIDIQKYKKLFLLTNGNSPILDNRLEAYSNIIDRDKLGSTQIVPVSKESHINEHFFAYLDRLNYMSVDRPSFGFIPEGEMAKPLSPYDNQLLLLKYQQAVESPLVNQPYDIHIGYDYDGTEVVRSFTGFLAPFTSAVVNTHVESKAKSIKQTLIYGIALSLFLYLFIPVFNRILFKKNHVFQYREIKEEGVTHNDPLKMSKIKDEDQVVRFGQHVMLLESWKYIKDNMSNPKYAKEYSHFYVNSVDGNLFNQQKGPFKFVLPIWLASVLATVLSLIYVVVTLNVFADWQSIEIYKSIQGQFGGEFPILSNSIIILSILLAVQCILEIIKWSRTKVISEKLILTKVVAVVIFSFAIVGTLYSLHIYELDLIPYRLVLIAMISTYVTIAYFGLPRQFSVMVIQQFLVVCLLAYLGFQCLPVYLLSSYFSDNIIFQIACFIFFSGIGCLCIAFQEEEQFELGLKVVSPPEIERDIFGLEQHFQNELNGEFLIGKNPEADLYVKWMDLDVQMNHARIIKTGDQFEIEPQDGNIYINSNQIFDKTAITRNDEIKFGKDSISHFTIINL